MINIVLCNYFKFLLRHNRRRNLADDTLAIVNFAHNTDNGCHEEHTVVYQSNFVRIGSIISLFDMICPKFIKSLNFQKVTKEATVVFFAEQQIISLFIAANRCLATTGSAGFLINK